MLKILLIRLLTVLMLSLLPGLGVAQVFPSIAGTDADVYDLGVEDSGEFNFVRVQFDTYWGGGFGYGTWSIDFPDADMNFCGACHG
jgi:hypothetical protein